MYQLRSKRGGRLKTALSTILNRPTFVFTGKHSPANTTICLREDASLLAGNDTFLEKDVTFLALAVPFLELCVPLPELCVPFLALCVPLLELCVGFLALCLIFREKFADLRERNGYILEIELARRRPGSADLEKYHSFGGPTQVYPCG